MDIKSTRILRRGEAEELFVSLKTSIKALHYQKQASKMSPNDLEAELGRLSAHYHGLCGSVGFDKFVINEST